MPATALRRPFAVPFDPDHLQAVLDRRPDAVRRFICEMGPILRGVVRRARARWSGTVLDEDDLLQEIFLALFHQDAQALRQWDPDRGRTLTGYLRVFAQFRAHDALLAAARSPGADPRKEDYQPDHEASAVASRDEGRGWIEHVVTRYRDECNDLDWRFLVRYANGATAAEMMTDFRLTRAAFDQRVHRMRKRLLVLRAVVGGSEARRMRGS